MLEEHRNPLEPCLLISADVKAEDSLDNNVCSTASALRYRSAIPLACSTAWS